MYACHPSYKCGWLVGWLVGEPIVPLYRSSFLEFGGLDRLNMAYYVSENSGESQVQVLKVTVLKLRQVTGVTLQFSTSVEFQP